MEESNPNTPSAIDSDHFHSQSKSTSPKVDEDDEKGTKIDRDITDDGEKIFDVVHFDLTPEKNQEANRESSRLSESKNHLNFIQKIEDFSKSPVEPTRNLKHGQRINPPNHIQKHESPVIQERNVRHQRNSSEIEMEKMRRELNLLRQENERLQYQLKGTKSKHNDEFHYVETNGEIYKRFKTVKRKVRK